MSQKYFENLKKQDVLDSPSSYPWSLLLRNIQFSQQELLSVKEWIEVCELVKFQQSVTKPFLREHFQKEIDECLEIDWTDVNKYVSN